jgi:hypothetical protein
MAEWMSGQPDDPRERQQEMEIESLTSGKSAGGGGAGLLIVGALAAAVIFLR